MLAQTAFGQPTTTAPPFIGPSLRPLSPQSATTDWNQLPTSVLPGTATSRQSPIRVALVPEQLRSQPPAAPQEMPANALPQGQGQDQGGMSGFGPGNFRLPLLGDGN